MVRFYRAFNHKTKKKKGKTKEKIERKSTRSVNVKAIACRMTASLWLGAVVALCVCFINIIIIQSRVRRCLIVVVVHKSPVEQREMAGRCIAKPMTIANVVNEPTSDGKGKEKKNRRENGNSIHFLNGKLTLFVS